MKTIKVRVEFIGKIWMPSTTCAQRFVVGDRDNARFSEPFNLEDDSECLEFIEHFLYGEKSGDFQTITDFQAIREVTETVDNRDGSKRFIHSHSEFTTIHPWKSEDNEMIYHDCVYSD